MSKSDVDFKTVNFISGLASILKPIEDLSVSEWAEEYMILPKGSNEAGRYSSATAKYQKEILNSMADPKVTRTTVMSSAQVGKSLMLKIGIGYYIAHDPSTQLMVLPTYDLGEKFSKTSLAPMISDVKILEKLVNVAKSRNSNNTVLNKSYPGGDLVIAGANSPSSLAALPRRIVWMDEVDRFPESSGTEGNPVLLAEARTKSYWNKKIIKTSTPTIKNHSKIEDAFYDGSMEEWNVKCPDCDTYQPFDFFRLDFDTGEMKCSHCGAFFNEITWKKQPCKWIAEHPERVDNRSFHLNEMASPFSDWKEMVISYQKALKRKEKFHDNKDLQVFINTGLGLPYDPIDDAETIDENVIKQRAELYEAELPDGVLLLTAAIDVQKNRFEVEFRGWAREYQSWGIYKTNIYGNLATKDPWDALEKLLNKTFYFSSKKGLNVSCFAIDSGYNTNLVYKWAKSMKKKGKKCYAVKGYSGQDSIPLLYKRTVVNIKNDKDQVIDKTDLYVLGVDSGKEDIMNRLSITEVGDGYCHFPTNIEAGYDDDYFKGLTSEHKVGKIVKGVYKETWVKNEGVLRNEPLDLFNYNYACLEILKPNFDLLETKVNAGINYAEPVEPVKKVVKKSSNRGGIDIWL